MKIVIDAMGGDNAPKEAIKGAVTASRELGISVILVGDEATINAFLKEEDLDKADILVVHASQAVTMEDNPATVMREKKDASIFVGLDMLSKGEGDAFVTAGNTGALLMGSTLLVKRIKGIRRAALAPFIITAKEPSLLIDCGANVECTAEYLLQFAVMGSYYVKKQRNIERPKVSLLNNGTEKTKGTAMVKAAHVLLERAGNDGIINFTGNIEGRDVPYGEADVVVCDGFTGNILLKTMEGVGLFFADALKDIFMRSAMTKAAALVVKPGLREFRKMIDYREVGGAPLLGISRPVIKAHGASNSYAFKSAIKQAVLYADSMVISDIEESIERMGKNLLV